MKIKRIHIEQFGKLTNLDLTLEDGFNQICQANGWGKTTLSVFIRTMFYGFPSKGERAKDRSGYQPWGQGIYGGSLTFSLEGHCYTVYRVFGKSKSGSEDTFRLIDEETRMESSRWSSRLGEELFGINEESFVNSAWIRQDGCSVTGDITSRLGGNPDFLEDIRQYDQVEEGLKKRLTRLSADRKTGLIYKTRLEKQELETELLRIPAYEKKISNAENEIREKEEKLKLLEAEKKEVQRLQQEYCDWQDYISMKEVHDTLQKEYLTRDELWEHYQNKFPDGIPKQEETAGWMQETKTNTGNGVWLVLGGIVLGILSLLFGFPETRSGRIVFFLAVLLLGYACVIIFRKQQSAGTGNGKNEKENPVQKDLGLMLVRQREIAAAENAWKELQKADRELRLFYENNPAFEKMAEQEIPSGLSDVHAIGELNDRLNGLNAEIDRIREELRALRQRLEGFREDWAELADRQEKLQEVSENLEKLEREYRITELTDQYLREAKEAFSARFLASIQTAFLQYYRMIDPEQSESLYIDAGYRICTMGGGLPRGEEVLSQGYQNLAAFCLRMALLDAMYKKEPPCLILDDPFVNLDQEKYERGMRFLKTSADRYQILYFSGR